MIALLAFTVLLAAVNPLRGEERLRAGQWENTMTVDGKSDTRTRCITAAEAETTNISAKAMREATEKALEKSGKGICTLKDLKAEGNTISMVTVCGATSNSTTTIYRGDTFETKRTSTTARVAKVMVIKGRRLGACP